MNQKDWDDSNLRRPGTLFGDIAIREDERLRQQQLSALNSSQGMGRTAEPWSREKALGFLGAIAGVVGAAALKVEWPWYGWVILFLGGWAAMGLFFKAFPTLAKLLVRLIQVAALAGVGYMIYQATRN